MNTISSILKKSINPAWVVKKGTNWAKSIWTLDNSDVVLVSFAKTGSTYFRIVLYNLFAGRNEKDQFTFDEVNHVMSGFGLDSFFTPWPFKNAPKVFIIRENYMPIFRNNRNIFLARDPRDIMVSFVPYARARKEYNFNGNLKDIVFHPNFGLERYLHLYSSWKPKMGLLIRYEDLRKQPSSTIQSVTNYLGLDFTPAQIQTALDASTLEKTRTAQKQSEAYFEKTFKQDQGFVFARSGSSGEGQEVFDDELNEYYLKLRKKYNFDLYPF